MKICLLTLQSTAVAALIAITCFTPAACGEESSSPDPKADYNSPIMLEPMKVDGTYAPKLSFGVSLEVWKSNDVTSSIKIRAVKAGSEAEEKGLVAGTRILCIDGQPVAQLAPSFRPGTDLNRIFVHRSNGAKVVLEVATPGESGSHTVILTERRSLGITLPSTLERLETR
jgi:C-terminal processing protease CtpA/Prc